MFNKAVFGWLNVFGWWPENAKTKRKKTLFKIYGYILWLSIVIQLYFEYIALYNHLKERNFKKILLNISTTMEGSWCMILLYNFMLKEKEILSIIRRNERLLEIARGELGDKRIDDLTRNVRRLNSLVWTTSVGGIVCTAHWVVTPIFLTLTGDEKIISYDTYIPWSLDTWTGYALTMILQTMHVISALCGLFLSTYLHYSILGGLEVNYKFLGEMFSKLNFENGSGLEKCVDFQVELSDLTNKVKKVYGKVQQYECINTVVVCCLCVVNGTNLAQEGNVTFSKVFNFSELALLTLVNFFFDCFLCQQVIGAAGDVYRSIYNNDWYCASIKNRKSLTIILERSRSPLLFGGPFAAIDLTTFIAVIKSIFSFYNFIEAMDSIV